MRLIEGAPLLVRGPDVVQVGVANPVTFARLRSGPRSMLQRMADGGRATAAERAAFPEVLAELARAGLLVEPPLPGASATINDAGPLGLAIAVALAQCGWGVDIEDRRPAHELPRHGYAWRALTGSAESAAAQTVRDRVPGTEVSTGRGWGDVAVVTSHGAATLEAAVPLMAADRAHVWVVSHERGATVGPLVMPGSGACGTCAALMDTDRDPAWPHLALQLVAAGRRPTAKGALAPAVAGVVVAALEAWRARDSDRHVGVERWLGGRWRVSATAPPLYEAVPARVDCGCGAAGAVGDEFTARRAAWRPETD